MLPPSLMVFLKGAFLILLEMVLEMVMEVVVNEDTSGDSEVLDVLMKILC